MLHLSLIGICEGYKCYYLKLIGISFLSTMGDPKNRRPSNMFGPRKTPSQSPYMRLLSRALSQSSNDGDGDNGGKFIFTK